MRGSAVLLVLASLQLSSCSYGPARIGEPAAHVPDDAAELHYEGVLDRWTRRANVYDRLDLTMFVAATEESVDFRTARAERLATFQRLPPESVKAMVDVERAANPQTYDFFLGVHTTSPKWNDFDRPESIWRIALRSDAGEVIAAQVDRIGRADLSTRGVYLYLGDFWTSYRVHFPTTFSDGRPLLAPGESQLTLRLSSAVGHADLVFEAVPVSQASPHKANTAPTR